MNKLPEILFMDKKLFSLEIRDDNKLTKIFRIIFGLICFAIAIFWLVYNFRAVKGDRTLWITVAFLVSFGLFQIYAGFGLATKFIEISADKIRLKKNSMLQAVDLYADQIEKMELFPLKVQIYTKSGKKTLLRFGVSNPEKVEEIKDEIIKFASGNTFTFEIKNEEV
jgi:hypothetical protein